MYLNQQQVISARPTGCTGDNLYIHESMCVCMCMYICYLLMYRGHVAVCRKHVYLDKRWIHGSELGSRKQLCLGTERTCPWKKSNDKEEKQSMKGFVDTLGHVSRSSYDNRVFTHATAKHFPKAYICVPFWKGLTFNPNRKRNYTSIICMDQNNYYMWALWCGIGGDDWFSHDSFERKQCPNLFLWCGNIRGY